MSEVRQKETGKPNQDGSVDELEHRFTLDSIVDAIFTVRRSTPGSNESASRSTAYFTPETAPLYSPE